MKKADKWSVHIFFKEGVNDPIGNVAYSDMRDLGFKEVKRVRCIPTYTIQGRLSEKDLKRVCNELLADPITQSFTYSKEEEGLHFDTDWIVEITTKPGVTDAIGETAFEATKLLGIKGVESVSSSFTYLIDGRINENVLEALTTKSLANPIIHNYYFYRGNTSR